MVLLIWTFTVKSYSYNTLTTILHRGGFFSSALIGQLSGMFPDVDAECIPAASLWTNVGNKSAGLVTWPEWLIGLDWTHNTSLKYSTILAQAKPWITSAIEDMTGPTERGHGGCVNQEKYFRILAFQPQVVNAAPPLQSLKSNISNYHT